MNQKYQKNVGVGVLDNPHFEGKAQKGITLIALVITIIVLLILAGVTINMVLGDDGIIGQAQRASEAQKNADEKEKAQIATGEAKTSEYMAGMTKGDVAKKTENKITNATDGVIAEIKKFEDGSIVPARDYIVIR